MKIKIISLFILFGIVLSSISIVGGIHLKRTSNTKLENNSNEYGVQWKMNFGSDPSYGARYEGPQVIGDTDGDGENELLVSGRDNKIRIFEWDEQIQSYLEMDTLFPPFYPFVDSDAGGMAIGDLTGDGHNEIGATWYTAIHKHIDGKYLTIGFNSYIFSNGGGNGDCYIGDYDNDGKNELIMSGGPIVSDAEVGNIVCFEWNGIYLKKEAEWFNPDDDRYTYVYMAGLGDIDEDGENEIVCGSSFKVWILDWNKNTNSFDETVLMNCPHNYYPFACVCKDSDNDGKNEIHVSFYYPAISIFEWNGENYEIKFETVWEDEGALIEALDVGNVDNDPMPEVCAGTNLIHILQWNGESYIEEAVLDTFGELAVLNIGDCDNDGKNEIHAGSVIIDKGQDFMTWVFKYGIESPSIHPNEDTGSLKVTTTSSKLDKNLNNASIAAQNLETETWYDIQPMYGNFNQYYREDLPEGEYKLRALMNGYKPQQTNINIISDEETTYDFSLEMRSKSLHFPPMVYRFLSRFF
jgi:hypothetical protein